jgi:hypothetical protein
MDKQKDFPELEGKEIQYKFLDGEQMTGVVVGCNYDIGITIMQPESDVYLLCVNGPSSPLGSLRDNLKPGVMWDDLFYGTVKAIQLGCVDVTFLFDLIETDPFNVPSQSTCPYNQ